MRLPVVVAILVAGLLLATGGFGRSTGVTFGLLLGTMFGQTAAAATWNALGPGPLLWRWPLSLSWVAFLVAVFAANVLMQHGSLGAVLLLATCVLGQWLLLQLPLWAVVWLTGWHIVHCDVYAQPRREAWQFQIRHIMVVTAIVAVCLGVGRVFIDNFPPVPGYDDLLALSFLLGVAVVVPLPLVFSALLPRFAIPATVCAALLVGLTTWLEFDLLRALSGPTSIDFSSLLWTNVFTSAWLLDFAVTLRWCDYTLAVLKPAGDVTIAQHDR